MTRAFTIADIDELRRRAASGEGMKAIARVMNRSPDVVYKKAKALGIKLAKSWHRVFTDRDIETIKLMAANGYPMAAIAKKLGKAPRSVVWKMAALGIRTKQKQSRSGVHRVLFKADPELWRQCAAAAKARDMSVAELARMVVRATVSEGLIDAVVDTPAPKAKPVSAPKPRVLAMPAPWLAVEVGALLAVPPMIG